MILNIKLPYVVNKINLFLCKKINSSCNFHVRKLSTNFIFNLNDRFKVHVIPALSDNFMYILADEQIQSAISVDPVEPDKICRILQENKLTLKAVLTTHHHSDHCGGNAIIARSNPKIPIYGGDDRIIAMTHKLSHEQSFKFEELTIKCLHTPCHTSGHVSYYININCNFNKHICFTGDTLFVGGCGKFFEGTADHMLKSLKILSCLPPDTLIFCGHEYTTNNLKFALSVEPNNQFTLQKLKSVEEKLKNGEPSVPSTIDEELSYNPFLRTTKESVQQFTKETDPVLVMQKLRNMKDVF